MRLHQRYVSLPCWAVFAWAFASCQANTPDARAPDPAAPSASSEQAGQAGAPVARAPGKAQPGVTSECGNYAVIAQGSLQVMNNVWAREKAQGPFEQCVLRRGTGGQAQLGWTWEWPGYEPGGYSFPEIIFGWKPWSAGSTDARLPIQTSALKELSLRYAISTESSGKLSLTAAIWLTTSGQAAAANPLAITDEIAILLDYPEGFTPPGTRGASLLVDGVDYGLWHTPNNGDLGNGTGWNLYYLQGPRQRVAGTLKLEQILEALRGKNLISAERYVASVEFGNELMSGSGTTWVNDFEVVVTPR